jgi:ketosteroid isomerase-like protein
LSMPDWSEGARRAARLARPALQDPLRQTDSGWHKVSRTVVSDLTPPVMASIEWRVQCRTSRLWRLRPRSRGSESASRLGLATPRSSKAATTATQVRLRPGCTTACGQQLESSGLDAARRHVERCSVPLVMTDTRNPTELDSLAARLHSALATRDLDAVAAMLDENVRWGGQEDAPETCHSRADVMSRLARQRAAGLETTVLEVVPGKEAILVGLSLKRPLPGGYGREHTVHQVLKVRDQRVVDIRGFSSRLEAAAHAGIDTGEAQSTEARQLVPILNVSSLADCFEWFAKLGWAKKWEWRDRDGMPGFGAIGSGNCEIFLCQNGQGGRGREGGIGDDGQGVWLSVWIDDVDAVHTICLNERLEVLRPPTDEPFGLREMHVRHPDGHVFRISQPSHVH